MSHNEHRQVNMVQLRDETKDILDNTRFLGHRYLVTRYGVPIAQITPPPPGTEVSTHITVTDIRLNAREILERVHHEDQTFLILRYGRADAILCPYPARKAMSPAAASTGDTNGTDIHPAKDELPASSDTV